MDDIDKFFTEIKQKRKDEKDKIEQDRKAKEEQAKSLSATATHNSNNKHLHRSYHKFGSVKGSSQFRSVGREQRERLLSNQIANNENMPEVGKYTPKYNVIRG